MKVIINHEKYGERSIFESLEEAKAAIRSCGPGFEDVELDPAEGAYVEDQDGDVVGVTIPTHSQYVAAARKFYADEHGDDMEIDENPVVSVMHQEDDGLTDGAWVMMWGWICRNDAAEFPEDPAMDAKSNLTPLEASLLAALRGLMDAEGGEPGDSQEQREAWKRAELAIQAAADRQADREFFDYAAKEE